MACDEWKAVYSDNTELNQFNLDGLENKYIDIDRSKLIQFSLYRNKSPLITVHLDSNKKLIYRKRIAATGFGCQIKEMVHLIGWQENVNGKNAQMLFAVFQDNHIEVMDRFKEGHQWLYPVNFLPEERI